MRHSIATAPLLRLATDATEADVVRIAAISALGQRPPDERVVDLLEEAAVGDGLLGDVARLALVDLGASRGPGLHAPRGSPSPSSSSTPTSTRC